MEPEKKDKLPEPKSSANRVLELKVHSDEEEKAFDFVAARNIPKPCGIMYSVAHLVKGALGSGVLSGHVGYKYAGAGIALICHPLLGLYITYCFRTLIKYTQVLYRRTHTTEMSYPDVGEAACICSNNPTIKKMAKPFRYMIDFVICLELFGSCATYQIIVAKTIKQLVEDTQETSLDPMVPGYPGLRAYLAILLPIFVAVCLLRFLKLLAPLSLFANGLIVMCVGTVIYYCFTFNPKLENLKFSKTFDGFFLYCGMCVFSMSCAGVILPVENNMKDPGKFDRVLMMGMGIIILITMCISFFGYAAFLEKSGAPITINFPMTIYPKCLKFFIAVMVIVTHGLNFWVPFNLVFHYIKPLHSPHRLVFWEYVYRIIFCLLVGLLAIVFPSITALMGFLGAFCLSLMAFIWPNIIELIIVWERPGLGKFKWRLWRNLLAMSFGLFLFFAGSIINIQKLINVFTVNDPKAV